MSPKTSYFPQRFPYSYSSPFNFLFPLKKKPNINFDTHMISYVCLCTFCALVLFVTLYSFCLIDQPATIATTIIQPVNHYVVDHQYCIHVHLVEACFIPSFFFKSLFHFFPNLSLSPPFILHMVSKDWQTIR